MTKPKLRFPINQIQKYADRFSFHGEGKILETVPKVQARGCLTKDELRLVARWVSSLIAFRIESNDDERVKEVTKVALSASHEEMPTEALKLLNNKPQYRQYSHERLRMEVLTLLNRVSFPIASIILHFFHHDKYPIMAVRALWSVSMELKRHEYPDHWEQYTKYCRHLADSAGVSMRTLDKALWQYSKEHQPPKTQ